MNFIRPQTEDLRFAHLDRKARLDGFTVFPFRKDRMNPFGVFLFPLNLGEQALSDALEFVPSGSFVFTGKGTNRTRLAEMEKNIHLTCLLDQKKYLLKNAQHTAEGVLAEIIAHTDRRLDDLCLLVYGYGNCGKAIARLLWLCGCEIWVWSRERGQALAQKDGFNLYPAPQKGLGMFDGIIDTVPDSIFSEEFLFTMQKNSSFFQVASSNSGIDAKKIESKGIRFVPLHGLPGKYCPASEADAIWDEIRHVLSLKRSTL